MKKILGNCRFVLILCAVAGANGCIMEEKVLEIVITEKTCIKLHEHHTSEIYSTPAVIDYAGEIENILEDKGVSRSEIKRGIVVSATHEVTSFSQSTNWIISGRITVRRTDGPDDGPVDILSYDSISVPAALGKVSPVDLNPDGVALLNRALKSFIDGSNPELEFVVISGEGDVDPDPTLLNPMIFNWQPCITIQVIIEQRLDVPDPF